jgi:hypothetical protein
MNGDDTNNVRICMVNMVTVTYSAAACDVGSYNTVAVEMTRRPLDPPKTSCIGVKNVEKLIKTNANGAYNK